MKISTTVLVIVLSILCTNFKCNLGIDPPNPHINLPIPYCGQYYTNYCGPACVQMWARWDDNHAVTQDQIAQEVGISPNSGYSNPYYLERAVGLFTGSPGHLERKPYAAAGAQGDLIAASIEGIKWSTPSIIPFDGGAHAVLVKGYEWRERSDGRPFAIRAKYHDPYNNLHDRDVMASFFLYSYDTFPADYWIILGQSFFVYNGILGHDQFVINGGTYYGGPSYYNPKNLDINIELPGEE